VKKATVYRFMLSRCKTVFFVFLLNLFRVYCGGKLLSLSLSPHSFFAPLSSSSPPSRKEMFYCWREKKGENWRRGKHYRGGLAHNGENGCN
jgi:hypothetical protein